MTETAALPVEDQAVGIHVLARQIDEPLHQFWTTPARTRPRC
jgi:hypothetical protein